MIKRVGREDAKRVAEFLQRTFTEDVASGGDPSIQTEDSVRARCEVQDIWVYTENGKVLGVLQGQRGGVIELWDKPLTFVYFNLLAIDWGLYKSNRSEAIRVARELGLASANALKASDRPPDLIIVEGPTKSRGSAWCRLLRMSEDFRGDWSWFILPFNLIWERYKATEAF